MKTTTKILLLLLFIGINSTVYFLSSKNEKNIISNELAKNLKTVRTHYDVLLESQKNIAYAIHKSILRNTDLMELLANSYNSTQKEQAHDRDKLHSQLIEQYETAKKQGVLQLHFVNKNNISYLRMHKPSKFGDDLTSVRTDYAYTNKTQKPVRGFIQGRVAHGFRNVFPIFDKNKEHIGAMEISFSSDRFQYYLNNIGKIHSHFIVDKNIFDSSAWKRKDLVMKYRKSSDTDNAMIVLGNGLSKEKCIDENKIKLAPVKNEINSKVSIGKDFATYVTYDKKVITVSFLAIKDLKDNTLAWIVSYQKSDIIKIILLHTILIRSVVFLLSLLLIYFFRQQILSKQTTEKQRRLFDTILNETEEALFITDFKSIKFANDTFKSIFSNKIDEESINNRSDFNIVESFIVAEGFLHKELLEKDENFISLLNRTEENNKIVSLLDEYSDAKAFKIHAVKVEGNGDYLVSLSDITNIKEELVLTSKKAYVDDLTNVYNRNKFNELIEEEFNRVQRYKHPLSMAVIDIDKFKDFNDNYGHLIGDEVLITMAKTVNDNVRATDTFARWGGEEFVILFKETEIENAKDISLKLKDEIEMNEHPTAGKITASFGLTQYQDGDTVQSIFTRCDEALYNAKANGRNRVEVQIDNNLISNENKFIFNPQKLLDDMVTFVAVLDTSGTILFVNNTPLKAAGCTFEEIKGTKFYDASWWAYSEEAVISMRNDIQTCARGESVLHEIQLALGDGTLIWIEYGMHPILSDDGEVEFLVPEGRDITEKKMQEEQLKQLAHFDSLTGLPNRTLFEDRFERAIAHTDRQKSLLAVCFLDLDNFKALNDTLGHEAGDSLLIEVSNRIKKHSRAVDTVSRFGGDEFAILLCGLQSMQDVEVSLERILNDLAKPYTIEGTTQNEISASCGVTLYPQDDSTPDQLLRNADQAMYKAKESGKNKFLYYDLESEKLHQEHRDSLNRISEALVDNEMVLFYQPKVNMQTGKMYGAEALIRWRHPEKGLLSPFHFLPQLEKTKQIRDIGQWVIKEALNQLQAWINEGKDWIVSINIDADHLMCPDFFEYLNAQLQSYPSVSPKLLEIEILETVSFTDISKVADIINRCNELGVTFALDDFGTGYSSLTYLKELPIHTVKIDQSFVRDMLVDDKDLTLIDGVIVLSKAFNLEIIAEGVETLEQGTTLARLGCYKAQGYYIAKPMASSELIAWEENYIAEKEWIDSVL